MQESDLIKKITESWNTRGRLWRNNLGRAWVPRGKPVRQLGGVFLPGGVMYYFGLPPGSSDCIGFTQVTITSDMIGKTLAVFTAVEVKTKIGKELGSQKRFRKMITESGGIAQVARNLDELQAKQFVPNFGQ